MQDHSHTFTWKLKKSAWVLLSFFGLAWAGLLFAGKKADNNRWRIAGGVYAVLQIGTFLACIIVSSHSALYDKLLDFWTAVYFLGIIHSFIILRMYLKCISGDGTAVPAAAPYSTKTTRPEADAFRPESTEELSPTEPHPETATATASAPSAELTPETAASPASAADPEPAASAESAFGAEPALRSTHIVNINTCSLSELNTLPGMTPEKVDRVLQYRNENGGFLSVEEFIAIADIPLEDEETVRERIYC